MGHAPLLSGALPLFVCLRIMFMTRSKWPASGVDKVDTLPSASTRMRLSDVFKPQESIFARPSRQMRCALLEVGHKRVAKGKTSKEGTAKPTPNPESSDRRSKLPRLDAKDALIIIGPDGTPVLTTRSDDQCALRPCTSHGTFFDSVATPTCAVHEHDQTVRSVSLGPNGAHMGYPRLCNTSSNICEVRATSRCCCCCCATCMGAA